MLAAVTGKTVEELKGLKLTGSHCWRNIGGEISGYMGWEAKDGNVLGDWANKVEPHEDRASRSKAKTTKTSTRVRHYQPNFSRDVQIAVRTRYLQAIKEAFKTYGIGQITWETTWLDLFPEKPPPSLKAFYGSRLPEKGAKKK